jgi:hypothetical protein
MSDIGSGAIGALDGSFVRFAFAPNAPGESAIATAKPTALAPTTHRARRL